LKCRWLVCISVSDMYVSCLWSSADPGGRCHYPEATPIVTQSHRRAHCLCAEKLFRSVWNAQFNLSQDSWLPAMDYPRASSSFPRLQARGTRLVLGYQFSMGHVTSPDPISYPEYARSQVLWVRDWPRSGYFLHNREEPGNEVELVFG
jgi:hypothetical protein